MFCFFLECESLFLRHRKSGKCIAAGELVYKRKHVEPYFAVMIDNCLKPSAQFRYLQNELLHNIDKDGTLVSPLAKHKIYERRWAIYKGIRGYGLKYQNSSIHRLKQTDGRLLLYYMKKPVCAEPQTTYVIRNKTCNIKIQRFTFGKII